MIKIGQASFIAFDVLYRNNHKAGQADGNWLTTNISVHTNAWHGQYNADLRAEELLDLKNHLEILNKQADYRFKFESKEPWIKLQVTGLPTGHMVIEGEACDNIVSGDKLKFSFKVDKSGLPKLLEDFKKVIKKFPVA